MDIGENLEGLAELVKDSAFDKERDVLRFQEWVYEKYPRFSERHHGKEAGGGSDVVVFMANGCVLQDVQRVGEVEVRVVEAGLAPGKGSLGDVYVGIM